jgi:hypothetical protein
VRRLAGLPRECGGDRRASSHGPIHEARELSEAHTRSICVGGGRPVFGLWASYCGPLPTRHRRAVPQTCACCRFRSHHRCGTAPDSHRLPDYRRP